MRGEMWHAHHDPLAQTNLRRRRDLSGLRSRYPGYQKLYARDIHIREIRKGQLNRSAMEEPRPGGTAFLITVTSAPGCIEFPPFPEFALR